MDFGVLDMDAGKVVFIVIGVCFLAAHVLIEKLDVYYHQICALPAFQ